MRLAWKRIRASRPHGHESGAVHRVLAKYGDEQIEPSLERAREAFERAFSFNPDLPVAHHLYTFFELDHLGRAEQAMTRLLRCVRLMPNDPDLYAGLVAACRYCGLLDASVAADRRAHQLDPTVLTSVENTWMLLSNEEQLRGVADKGALFYFLCLHDRLDEARRLARELHLVATPVEQVFLRAVEAAVDGRADEIRSIVNQMRQKGFRDPEGWAYSALVLARAGAHEDALDLLDEAVDAGYTCPDLRFQPWSKVLHGHERFERAMARAVQARDRAAEAFRAADGYRLLGMSLQ